MEPRIRCNPVGLVHGPDWACRLPLSIRSSVQDKAWKPAPYARGGAPDRPQVCVVCSMPQTNSVWVPHAEHDLGQPGTGAACNMWIGLALSVVCPIQHTGPVQKDLHAACGFSARPKDSAAGQMIWVCGLDPAWSPYF